MSKLYKVYGWSWIIMNIFEAKHTISATLLKRFKDNDIISNFLTGLNNEFDPIRIRVLKKELSSLNETITSFLAQPTRG